MKRGKSEYFTWWGYQKNVNLWKYESIDKYSYRATKQEVEDNDYNLNIPRYVDTFEEEIVDIDEVNEISQTLKQSLKRYSEDEWAFKRIRL